MPALHWPIARDCLEAGLHLQVQKPIAITIADGRRIIDTAREKGRALVVSEPSVLGRGTRADRAPTAPQREVYDTYRKRLDKALADWQALENGPMLDLRNQMRAAGLQPVV